MKIQDNGNRHKITGNENLLDSTEIESRMKYLFSLYEKEVATNIDYELEREVEEYKMLEQVKKDALTIYLREDWEEGIVFVRNTYFEEYIGDRLSDDYNLDDLPDIIRCNINWKDVARNCAEDYKTVFISNTNYYTLKGV